MKRKRLIAAVVAVLLAMSGVGAMWWYASRADQRAVADLQPVDVFVAALEIPTGTSLATAVSSNALVVKQIPASLAPVGASTVVDASNASLVAQSNIHVGELVLLSRFGAPETVRSGLMLPPGHIALSISLGDPEKVGTFVNVSSRIAVFLTYGADNGQRTRLLMSNIYVLAVGANAGAAAPAGTTGLLTLAVTQTQAEKLIQAQRGAGQLYLGLMNEQSGVSPSTGTNTDNLFG